MILSFSRSYYTCFVEKKASDYVLLDPIPRDYFTKQPINTYNVDLDFFYKPLKEIQKIDSKILKQNKVINIQKDTAVVLDLKHKLLLKKNYFYQKPYDEKMLLSLKTNKDLNVFIYQYALENGSFKTEFMKTKKKGLLKKMVKLPSPNASQRFNYEYYLDGVKYNGYATGSTQEGLVFMMIFESKNMDTSKLLLEVNSFILRHLIKE